MMATIGRGVSELGTRISELRGCAVGVAVALVLVAAGSTDARRITLKMGSLAPEGTPWHHMLMKMGEDWSRISEAGYRYDITVIPPGRLGREFTKTAGHDHPLAPGGISYTEIYEVLEGEATYLMQKTKIGEGKTARIEDVYFVKAKKGDKVLIPPDYGHITINAGTETLKMANWVCRHFHSTYDNIKSHFGGAYFLLAEGGGSWHPNDAWGKLPELRQVRPTDPKLIGLSEGEAMYNLIGHLEWIDFLDEPEKHGGLWEKILWDSL